MLSKLFNRHRPQPAPKRPSTHGPQVFAIGDIHGRLDLLDALLRKIVRSVIAERPQNQPALIFLGDYVDRGPESRGVIERLIELRRQAGFKVHLLKGNHEAQMLQFLADPYAGPPWIDFGGAATLESYGVRVPRDRADEEAWETARRELAAALPPAHLEFLNSLRLGLMYGDYLFVHAGVRPGVPLEEQDERDLLWIRNEFLNSDADFGKVIVHGHTPDAEPYLGRNRINVDTGAYATGKLSAIRLEGEEQEIIQAET